MNMFDLVARYRDGQRDFRGADLRGALLQNADLSGIDLSGADLRGADFTGARLEGAKLKGVRCGALWRWRLARELLGLIAAAFSGALLAFSARFFAQLFDPNDTKGISIWTDLLFLVLLTMFLWQFVRRGILVCAVIFVVVFSPLLIAMLYTGLADVIGNLAWGAPLVFAATVVAAVTGAGYGAGIGVAFLFAVALVSDSEWVAPLLAMFVFPGTLIAQLVATWLVRRRAFAGAPEHAWIRDFAVAVRGLKGTRFRGTDLGQADFGAADLHGADLRCADLDGTRFRDTCGLDWARFDPCDLRKPPMQRLLMSGVGAGQDFSGLRFSGVSLRGADLTSACLRGADLGGVDLSEARLDGAILDKVRVDAQTYLRSGWTPRMLAAFHRRGVEVVALQAFPPDAQDVVVGLRDGLVLSFAQPLTHFRQHLIEGSLYAIVGIESGCRIAEYREKDDGTSFVRIVGGDRAELERVAEAFYQRVWEKTRTSSSRELARVNELLSDALRQRLSELVRELVDIELRQPVAEAAESTALVRRSSRPGAVSEPVWRWDQRSGRVSFSGQRPRRLVILHAPSEIDTGLCQELLMHMEGLKGQGLLETFHAAPPGEVVAERFAAEIAGADAVLVLLSAELLSDAGCQGRLAVALRAEETAQRLFAVPVVLRACDWEASPLGGRQCLPESGRPIMGWGTSAAERDTGWVEVISALRRHLLSLSTAR